MTTWADIQSGIFAGESGGDYGALYGFANRPGKMFSDVDVRNMTINEVLDFQNPQGPYAQYVGGLNKGVVSSPAGAYQIVGRTLRDARDRMGLTGGERFDEAMQDRIGRWIYDTQGTGAWEGYQGPRSDGMATAVTPQQAGLLGAIEPTQRDRRRDLAGRAAMAFNTLRQRPDAAIPAIVEARRGDRQANRTAQWLAQQPGGEVFANMIAAGASGAQALQAYQASMAGPEYRQATGAELGMSPEFANQVFNVGADGKVTAIGGGGTNVTNVLPGGPNSEDELRKQLMGDVGETWAGYSKAGGASAGAMSDLDVLQEIADLSPSGTISGRLAEMFPEANDVAALRQSIVKRVGPTLRAEGSGSTSDIEYAGMINSLGSLRNTPEANKAIIAVMQSQAQFNMDRAAVVNDYASQKINYQQAIEKLSQLDAGSRIPEQVKAIIDNYSDATTEGGGLTVGTIEDGYRYNGGPPHLESSWEAVK